MKQDDTVKILEKNVRDLQSQLVECHKRVATLSNYTNVMKTLIRDNPNDQQLGKEIRNIFNNESV